MPSCMTGYMLGMFVELGATAAMREIASKSIAYNLAILAVFSAFCLLLSLFWRVPRKRLFGSYHVSSIASFVGGFVFFGGVVVSGITLARFKVFDYDQAAGALEGYILLALVCVWMVLGIECEAYVSRRLLPSKESRE